MSLSGIIGADASELPVCLSEVWDDGVPLDDAEKRECIRLFCLLMRDRGLTEDGAKIAISKWSGNPALTESECSRAYASSEKLTCKLLQNVRYVGDRCEREFCEFPAWNKNKSGKTRAKTEQTGPTVLDAIKKLTEKNDRQGFSKFDQEEHDELIKKAISEGYLSPTEEKAAYRLIKKYKKQLKKYGMEFDEIGHISRDGDDTDNGLREINERIPRWIADHHFKTVADTPADESLDSENADSNLPQIDRLIVVRFLQDTPSFVGTDGIVYGPFRADDVATIPEINARGLFKKDAIVAVNVGGKEQ